MWYDFIFIFQRLHFNINSSVSILRHYFTLTLNYVLLSLKWSHWSWALNITYQINKYWNKNNLLDYNLSMNFWYKQAYMAVHECVFSLCHKNSTAQKILYYQIPKTKEKMAGSCKTLWRRVKLPTLFECTQRKTSPFTIPYN